MLDDYESGQTFEENTNSNTSDKFYLKKFELDEEQKKETIVSMTSSRKYIFFLTESHNIFLAKSNTLETISESFSLPNPREKNNFKDHFNKIWVDREGNHCIIRHNDAIYYFNSELKESFELDGFRGKEICAVGLDDRNIETNTTKYFLAVDYDNKIYQCCIEVAEGKVKDQIEELTTIFLSDPGLEEEDELDKKKSKLNDRIYGIKFAHATNTSIESFENTCYIIAVTHNRLYQFMGPGLTNFKQIFSRFEKNPALINDNCKHFPKKGNSIFKVEFDVLYKNEARSIGNNRSKRMDVFNQFGWRTDSGYCFGDFVDKNNDKSSGVPLELKKFTVIPFQKITDKGTKIMDPTPISMVHTFNHIFILYSDCLTVISKLTSNIVYTEYFDTKYEQGAQMIYNEFSKDKGSLLLSSKNGVELIPLKNENDDIWRDYLDIGDFNRARSLCNSDKIRKKINRIDAEKEFKISRLNSVNTYLDSDEKFETICLKYLREGDLDALKLYLEMYKTKNILADVKNDKKDKDEEKILSEEQKLQLNLITTWTIEIFLSDPNSTMKEFSALIKEFKKNVDPELIYQILLSYGKMEEYEKFSVTLEDYKRVVIHRINQGQIGEALSFIYETAGYLTDYPKESMKLLIKLGNIFLENSHLFFQNNPEEAFGFLFNILIGANVEINNYIENIVLALMSRADKDIKKFKDKDSLTSKEKIKLNEDSTCILKNLKKLMENTFRSNIKNQIKGQMNNIQNVYILYLSLNPGNNKAILTFLEKYIQPDKNGKKLKISFQLDYAKTLLKDNKLAYAYILALMGKYSEGISYVLKKDEKETLKEENEEDNIAKEKEEIRVAEFIAKNVPDKKLQKTLWIQIFKILGERNKDNTKNEEKLAQALNIMDRSGVLKIEDVLPYITDSLKIEEFKTHISECISQYEENINELKQNIRSYNQTAENIKIDINKAKKKPMEIKYNEFKCEICRELIRNKRIFLFPCGHMFDMDCIRKRLLDYENTGLENLHEDNVKIDKLFYELGYINRYVFKENDTEEKVEEPQIKKEETIKKIGGIFSKIKNEFSNIGGIKKEDLKLIKEQKEKSYLSALNELLSKNCVLCGNFLVDSVQCSLDDKSANEPNFDL